MDDLSAIISKVLSDPESMRNLQQAAASLGLSTGGEGPGGQNFSASPPAPPPSHHAQGSSRQQPPLNWTMGGSGNSRGSSSRRQRQQPEPPPAQDNGDIAYIKNMLEQLVENTRQPPPPAPVQSQGQQSPGLDLSALSGILGGLAGGGQASDPPAPGGDAPGFDLSTLSGILGGLTGGASKQQTPPASGVSALTAMLGGNEGSSGGPLGMNMNTLLKFQQAMSSLSANAGNVRLMMALKGQLKDQARINKVDDAVKVMQVIQFLPILKESGIFGKFDEILDGFNLGGLLGGGQAGSGGLSGILSGLTGSRSAGGLGSLLSSLTGRR